MKEKLTLLWTSDNRQTALNMVAMYATNAKQREWFSDVMVLIWGGANTLIQEEQTVQEAIGDMLAAGIVLKACKACADDMGTTDILESLGVTVEYTGELLTSILKDKTEHLLTV